MKNVVHMWLNKIIERVESYRSVLLFKNYTNNFSWRHRTTAPSSDRWQLYQGIKAALALWCGVREIEISSYKRDHLWWKKSISYFLSALMSFSEHCFCFYGRLSLSLCIRPWIAIYIEYIWLERSCHITCQCVMSCFWLLLKRAYFLLGISLITPCMFEWCNVTLCQACYKQQRFFL